jgi:hypothetical protein
VPSLGLQFNHERGEGRQRGIADGDKIIVKLRGKLEGRVKLTQGFILRSWESEPASAVGAAASLCAGAREFTTMLCCRTRWVGSTPCPATSTLAPRYA